jgi:hypothetical protein
MSQKKTETLIDEEKDFYLSFINKKLRNIRKKLDQIEELLRRDQTTLKSEQMEKINSRQEVLQSVKHFEELKDLYYSAFKAAGEEAKQAQKETSSKKVPQNETSTKDRKSSQEDGLTEESRKTYREEIIRETVTKILNFASISQILNNSTKREDLSKLYEAEDKDSFTQGLVHLNNVQELHKSIFDIADHNDSVRIEDRVNQSIEKLTSYVSGEDQIAFGDKTYKSVQENVERIVNFSSYKNLTFAKKEQQKVQQEVQVQVAETLVVVVPQEESPAPLSSAAAILKPDIDDFAHSPEKGRYLPKEPKMVRFVDEIERDMQSNQTKQRDTSSNQSVEGEIQVAKESKQPEESLEQEQTNQEPQEQKSFRKNGSNYRKPKTDYNANGGFNSNQKRYRNEGSRGYQGRGNGAKYQYTEYVQKRPSGEQ